MECTTGDVSDFFAELWVEWQEDEAEMKAMVEMCEDEYKDRAKKVHVYNMGVFSRQGVEKSLSGVTREQFSRCYPVPPSTPQAAFTLSVKMLRNSVWVGGRYNKLTRDLPQTPWLVEGVRRCDTSLEEVIAQGLDEAVKVSLPHYNSLK